MSRSARPVVLAFLLFGAGCATLRPDPPADRNAALRLEAGLAALEQGRTAQAFDELAWVVAHCHGRTAGLHARSALAALELDPRNPAGRPDVGVGLLAELILDETTPLWIRPVAEVAYLMALGLGAPAPAGTAAVDEPGPPDSPPADTVTTSPVPVREAPVVQAPAAQVTGVRGCGDVLPPVAPAVLALPALPGPSLAALLRRAEQERQSETARAEGLQSESERLRRELEATRAELDRIRRTLRP